MFQCYKYGSIVAWGERGSKGEGKGETNDQSEVLVKIISFLLG
jgi:hypothetical protein